MLGTYTKAPLKSADPDVRDALRLATFQLLFLDRVPAYAAVDDAVDARDAQEPARRRLRQRGARRVATEGRAEARPSSAEGDDARSWAAALLVSAAGW